MPHEGKISLKKTFHDTLTRTGMGFATKNYLLLNLMIQSLFSPMYSLNIEIYTNCGRCNLKCTGTWDRNPRIVDHLLHFQRKKFSPDIRSTSFLTIAAGIYTFQLQLFPKFEYFIMRLNLNRLCCGWKDQHQDFITTFESKTLIDIALCNSTSQYTSKATLDGGGEVSSSPAI